MEPWRYQPEIAAWRTCSSKLRHLCLMEIKKDTKVLTDAELRQWLKISLEVIQRTWVRSWKSTSRRSNTRKIWWIRHPRLLTYGWRGPWSPGSMALNTSLTNQKGRRNGDDKWYLKSNHRDWLWISWMPFQEWKKKKRSWEKTTHTSVIMSKEGSLNSTDVSSNGWEKSRGEVL